MKQFLIIAFLFLLNVIGLSQINRAKNWYFGVNAGLSFTNSPGLVSGGAITTSIGCSAISDLSGNLLFYTDGVTVYNSTHTVMPNGTGLHGINASQSSIILKQPGNNNIYYIFTVGGISTSFGLEYSIVDMALASGTGSVTIKNVAIDWNCRDKISAAKHCNGSDLWAVATTSNSSNQSFTSVLLTSTGISSVVPSYLSVGNQTIVSNPFHRGEFKISPNSRKFSLCLFRTPTSNNNPGDLVIQIGNFDNTSGTVALTATSTTNAFPFNYFTSVTYGGNFFPNYGTEFSSTSQFVYFSHGNSQIDLCATSSLSAITNYSLTEGGFDTLHKKFLQLAGDGKIYGSCPGRNNIAAISNINSWNTARTSTFSLGTYTCQWSLPNFPGFYFEQKPNPNFTYTSNLSCFTTSFSTAGICTASGYSITGYQWNFGDVSSGTNNISFLQNPSHTFSNTGTYSVSLIRYFLCNTNDTITQIVNITQPTLSINISTLCTAGIASVQVNGGVGPFNYVWSNNTQTNASVSYTSNGIYTVTVSDQNSGGCSRTSTFAIVVPTINTIVSSSPSLICHGSSNGTASVNIVGGSGVYSYTWSQNNQNSNTINGLSAGNHAVTVNDNLLQCLFTRTFTINQASSLNLQLRLNTQSVCEGNNIVINANMSGGVAAYNYSWTPVNTNTNVISISPSSGNYIYTLLVTDAMACSVSNTIGFSVWPNPTVAISNMSACINTSVSLNASGANSFTWLPSNYVGPTYTTNAITITIFTVTGSNVHNCISTNTTQLMVVPASTINASCNSPVCVGQTVNFTSGNINTYVWNGPNNFISSLQNPQILNVQFNSNGIYTLVTTDANGCKDSLQIHLVVNTLPQVLITTYTTSICIGQLIQVNVSGANTYTWSNGSNNRTILISPLTNTLLTASGTNTLTGCMANASLMINIKNCNPDGLTEKELTAGLYSIYPNPFNNSFYFEKNDSENCTISISQMDGRTIYTQQISQSQSISMEGFPNGMYLLTVHSNNARRTFKIIKE